MGCSAGNKKKHGSRGKVVYNHPNFLREPSGHKQKAKSLFDMEVFTDIYLDRIYFQNFVWVPESLPPPGYRDISEMPSLF